MKEVLGPRLGPNEILSENPLTEYLTGVLAPFSSPSERNVDSDSPLPQVGPQWDEDEGDDADVEAPPLVPPALDPKSRPGSMGISFFVTSDQEPALDVCLTWARYKKVETATVTAWQREPHSHVETIRLDSEDIVWIADDGATTTANGAVVSFERRVRGLAGGESHVTLYLVNRIRVPPGGKLRTEHHLFQPQIRVVCRKGTVIVPRSNVVQREEDERRLESEYSDRPIYARGHICSAVWREVDPEIAYVGHIDSEDARSLAPFAWTDSGLLQPGDSSRFSHSDVRTEFVPVYPIPGPVLNWPGEFGESPELRAGVLAETWDPKQLRRCLAPLVVGYQGWIAALSREAEALNPERRQIGRDSVRNCGQVLSRLQKGIDLLCSNDDARLAFCFANKAIDLQSRWTRKKPITWWPFQLGFILLSLESVLNVGSADRDVCDLLWVPTGAGKTEAYLALAALTAAHRRLRARANPNETSGGAGVSVLSRYTLRLLTIQQFRRSLTAFTACEVLRVDQLGRNRIVGWRPKACPVRTDYLWGTASFGVGLWVGGDVTPNRLQDLRGQNSQGRFRPIRGALSILQGEEGAGEPAQVVNCPACSSVLAVPSNGLGPGTNTLHFVVRVRDSRAFSGLLATVSGTYGETRVSVTRHTPLASGNWSVIALELRSTDRIGGGDLGRIWQVIEKRLGPAGVQLECAHPARPGYFIRRYQPIGRGKPQAYDFDIYCPNPNCPLTVPWIEATPAGHVTARTPHLVNPEQPVDGLNPLPDGVRLCDVQEPFQAGSPFLADRVRINAFTVDEQVYHRVPTMLVSTVDKFARPAFEPKAASIFGNVSFHHCIHGYYRPNHHSRAGEDGHPGPTGVRGATPNYVAVPALDPPDLIMQDELHLVEGPLGSLVGLYETAIDFLCREEAEGPAKYISSTATTRQASDQVTAVFARRLQTFPPVGLSFGSRFFISDTEEHALDDVHPGRLYVGICAPGRGPLTPVYRIWARLLQTAYEQRAQPRVDPFWTLTGYFNAIRELGGASALYRQDIQERLPQISPDPRPLDENNVQELSSRSKSTDLPGILEQLNVAVPSAQDALLTTSMFGTGVDVPRLGLMVVHGQPKTTSAYIQSTGRVGRASGGLVITFLRSSRPRDLNHYEFFIGYHRQLHRFVEPVTAYPFAPGALERGVGPVAVFIARNMRRVGGPWSTDPLTIVNRRNGPEVAGIVDAIEARAQSQPGLRRPPVDETRNLTDSRLDLWMAVARQQGANLEYVEYAIGQQPSHPVVLGDPQHRHRGLPVVYRDVPESLRTVEETTGFQT